MGRTASAIEMDWIHPAHRSTASAISRLENAAGHRPDADDTRALCAGRRMLARNPVCSVATMKPAIDRAASALASRTKSATDSVSPRAPDRCRRAAAPLRRRAPTARCAASCGAGRTPRRRRARTAPRRRCAGCAAPSGTSRATAESTFGAGRNAPAGTVKSRVTAKLRLQHHRQPAVVGASPAPRSCARRLPAAASRACRAIASRIAAR